MNLILLSLTVISGLAAFKLAEAGANLSDDVKKGIREIHLGEDLNGVSYKIAACNIFSVIFIMATAVLAGFTIGTMK